MVSGLHSYLYWLTFRSDALPPEPQLPVGVEGWAQFIVGDVLIGTGASAVTLFFTISGFVLSLSIGRMQGAPAAIALRFVSNRIFRLYPAVIVATLAWAILEPSVLFQYPRVVSRTLSTILANGALLATNMNWATWSLRVEIAATPLFLVGWLVGRRWGRRGLLCLALALLAQSFFRQAYGEDMIGRYLFVFVLGMLIPEVAPRLTARLRPVHAMAVLVLAVAADILARPILSYHAQSAILIEAFSCFAALGIVVYGPMAQLRTFLERRTWRFLGRISYSYYLLHFLVLWALLRQVPDAVASAITDRHPLLGFLLVWTAVIVVTVPLALLSYRWVEMPGVALGRRLFAGRRLPAAARSDAVAS